MAEVPKKILDDIVDFLAKKKGLKFGQPGNFAAKIDRHRGFFLRRRAAFIGAEPANAWMVAETGQVTLVNRVDSEYEQVNVFLTAKAKALDPTTGGIDKTPPHLDLHDLAKPKDTTSASVVRSNETMFRQKRWYRVRSIGWRAAAIHNELWLTDPTGDRGVLRRDVLDELIDRRLRMVERMNLQVSRADALAPWRYTTPWHDGFRVRMFEYPRIQKNHVSEALTFIDPDEIEPPGTEPFQPGAGMWRRESKKGRLIWNVPPYPGLRTTWAFDKAKVDSMTTREDKLYWGYFRNLKEGDNPAKEIDKMFVPHADWRQRSWLFCDHVISALHLEALLFARRRQDPANAEQQFNDLMKPPTGPISIGGFLARAADAKKAGRLLSMDNDPQFDNITIDEGDLQVGDHVIVYNSKIFWVLSPSEWVLENSVVMDIDSDPATGAIVERTLLLQGHGTYETDYGTYLQRAIADPFNEFLNEIRQIITTKLASTPTATSADFNGERDLLVRWDPYDAFSNPGPWWIKLNMDPAKGKEAILGSVIDADGGGTGYKSPPSKTAVYFPLHLPAFKRGWDDYLKARRTTPTLKVPRTLQKFIAGGDIMPGLFYYRKKRGMPIPVLRPKVTI